MTSYDQFPVINEILDTASALYDASKSFSDELYIDIFSAIHINIRNALTANTVCDLALIVKKSNPRTELAKAFSKGIFIQAAIAVTQFEQENEVIRKSLTLYYDWLGVIPNDDRDLVSVFDFIRSVATLGRIDDPMWLVANIESRHKLVGKDGYQREVHIAQELVMRAKEFHPVVYLLAMVNVAEISQYYRDYKAAFAYGQQVIILANQLGRDQDQRVGLIVMAGALLHKTHDRSAIHAILEYWDHLETRSTSLIRQSELNSILWQLYYHDKEYEKALELARFSLDIAHATKSFMFEVRMLLAIGMIYTKQRDFRRAVNTALDAIELARFHQFYEMHVWALHIHGWALLNAEKYEESVEILTKCLLYQRQLEFSFRKLSFENNIVPDLAKALSKTDRVGIPTLKLISSLISTLENEKNIEILQEILRLQ